MIAFLLCFVLLGSQAIIEVNDIAFPGLDRLSYTDRLPEELLSSRSVCFIKSSRAEWKEIGKAAHEYFIKANIDAVAYYHLDDITAGVDAQTSFTQILSRRSIEHIIFILKPEGQEEYEIIITPFNGEESFISANQPAWRINGRNYEYLLKEIYRTAANSRLTNTNHLIIDRPEFFTDTEIINSRRYESYYLDLKLDKLAVPLFPESDPNAEAKNQKLKEIFSDYPHDYKLVDPGRPPSELRSEEGFQIILRKLHTAEQSLLDMLDYSGIKGSNESMYKFYVKHIYTGNVFLGPTWDADPSWDQALKRHLSQIR